MVFAALASSLLLLVSPLTPQAELPTKRIDCQLHSAQLAPTAVSVPVSFASDHLPVAATYSLS